MEGPEPFCFIESGFSESFELGHIRYVWTYFEIEKNAVRFRKKLLDSKFIDLILLFVINIMFFWYFWRKYPFCLTWARIL